ncbi:helix-turn-helix domain-containing protein [Catenulispora pinisilvae]|uniref:helix-turn-helix domain-containing protein n=1 Tax=Catenulispora pinisilvae TaxID=2705253 RepID=UPI0034DD1DE7
MKGWRFARFAMVTVRARPLHVRTMRYPDRGGLTMKARAAREALRFAAAERFERGDDVGEIARELSVTRKSVNEWKRAWRAGGAEALASKGPGRGGRVPGRAAGCR